MTNNGKVTLEKVYTIVNRIEDKFDNELKDLRTEVDCNTSWRNRVMGQITIIFAVVGIAVNWVWDFFTTKK